MCAGQESFKNVVTFTFHENKVLGDNFVKSLKEAFGEENVISIDQSTYGIKNGQILTINDLRDILEKAEEAGCHHKDGDELNLLVPDNNEIKQYKYVCNPSEEYLRQHPLMRDKK